MRHSTWQRLLMPVLLVSSLLVSCGKDNPAPTPTPPSPDPGTPTEVPLKTQRINRFIVEAMRNRYLWNSDLPSEIDITSESDPAALFKRLRNPQDSWSVLSDNIQQTQGEFTNETRSYGYELTFGKFNNSENMFAVVLFTYPDSPAAKAGIKRGDIFIRVNDMEITMNTYMNLFRFPNVSLQYGHLEGNTIYPATQTTTLTGTEMYLDPVITYSVIDRAGHKIGYLCYSDFVSKSIGRLEEVFSTFQQQQVTEIILDLRYNPGGEVSAMAKLSSMLAPKSAVESHSVLQTRIYNKEYTEYLRQTGTDVNDYFDPSVAVNLNGLPLYTLTESSTASASESLILCLKPYMTVKQVGSSTAGKYCGGSLFQPAVQQGGQLVPDPEIGNWVLYLIDLQNRRCKRQIDLLIGPLSGHLDLFADFTRTETAVGRSPRSVYRESHRGHHRTQHPNPDRNEIRRSGVHPAARTNGPTQNTLRLADRFDRYDSRNRRFALTESESKNEGTAFRRRFPHFVPQTKKNMGIRFIFVRNRRFFR